MSVAVINYGLGNLKSVVNAIGYLGADVYIAEKPDELQNASHVILPGVGAFGEGMQILKGDGWVDDIKTHAVQKQKPFLGICLGMQLLASRGTEYGDHEGLGLISGVVDKMKASDKTVRIPHIGWNPVSAKQGFKTYDGLDAESDFYFVHSYAFKPEDESVISGTCQHGTEFVASVEKDNIWGAQFHPEKSQKSGLRLLQNFLTL